jgi:hypothetical protein
MAAGLILSACAWAQDEDAGRGVARISLLNGDVSVRRGDSGDWVAAAINAPLVVNDHVLTGSGSHAEVQFDYANFLRLSSDAEVRLSELENKRYQIQISRGTVTFRVLRDALADVELDTPNVSVRPTRRGVYRITVSEDGQSEVTVRSGEADTFTPKGSERLGAGKTMLVRGTASDPEFQVVREIAEDSWDRWNEDRDRKLERTRSYQYVSRDVYGADDLDGYGRWVNAAPYGWVWSPSGMGPDWAPYRSGRWVWVDWYGWTWVSYDPWGWAPYHYGRWFHSGPYGWCWYPGERGYHHSWSPALVAFFGYGGVGVGVGFGSVGWVPLGPHEPFYPWYGRRYYGQREMGYLGNRMVVNNINITNVYRNARVHNGVTGIDAGGFARGGRGGALEVSAVARQASVMRGPVPVTPVASSIRFNDNAPRVMRQQSAAQTRFVTQRTPRQVERVSFEDQRRNVEQYVHRSYGAPTSPAAGRTAAAGGTGGAGQVRVTDGEPAAIRGNANTGGGATVRQQETSGGWRRVGESQPGSVRTGTSATGGNATGGAVRVHDTEQGGNWRRFGGSGTTGNAGATGAQTPSVREQVTRTEGNSGAAGQVRHEQAAPRSERTGSSGETGTNTEWRRFGGNSGSGGQGNAREQAAPRQERNETAPRRDRSGATTTRQDFGTSSGNSDWRSFGGSGSSGSGTVQRQESPRYSAPRSESVRINAPIVRERSEARTQVRQERSSGGGGGGQMTRSAPSAPARSEGARPSGGGNSGGGGRGRSR